MENKKKSPIRVIVEGALCIALAVALSYLKFPIGLGIISPES